MIKLKEKQQKILGIFLAKGNAKSSDIHTELNKDKEKISLVTVKRALAELAGAGVLNAVGSGRSAGYEITALGRISADVNAAEYCLTEPDKRFGLKRFNFDLWRFWPTDLFDEEEKKSLDDATQEYFKKTKDLPLAIQKKELERLVIELSWKSSKIEGNTYTLLDTEKLIRENQTAPGHSQLEARMILNHKDAFYYLRQHARQFKTVTKKNLEELHAVLVKDLSVGLGLRAKPMGVTGSKYLPLDNSHQITEAINELSDAVSKMANPYAKALLALLGVSYLQPFEDGNKRTSRLIANAVLMAHSLAPLSYRSVDENEYREAMLVFYELNSVVPMKKIFIGQYEFAVKNYAVK